MLGEVYGKGRAFGKINPQKCPGRHEGWKSDWELRLLGQAGARGHRLHMDLF